MSGSGLLPSLLSGEVQTFLPRFARFPECDAGILPGALAHKVAVKLWPNGNGP
jgi:hypothetical protein